MRPGHIFWEEWSAANDDVRQQIWDGLCSSLMDVIRIQREAEERAVVDWEAAININLGLGAPNRATAIRWVLDASAQEYNTTADDVDYIVFRLGLPTSMTRQILVELES